MCVLTPLLTAGTTGVPSPQLMVVFSARFAGSVQVAVTLTAFDVEETLLMLPSVQVGNVFAAPGEMVSVVVAAAAA